MKLKCGLIQVAILISALAFAEAARSASPESPATQANQQAVDAAVDSLSTNFAMFQTAAQQWVASNLTGDGWNNSQTLTAYAFGTYAPILLYAGSGTISQCGAPSAVTTSYNLVAAGFLPTGFSPAYSGEYCAIVYPDSGTTNISGPVGPNGGSTLAPASTLNVYVVATAGSTPLEGILDPSTAMYAVNHLGTLIAEHYAGGGQVKKFTPTYTSNGTNNGQYAWQGVQP
jgi:hypothetical protein